MVAKDHPVFSQRCQEESLKLLFPVVENPEPAIMCDFASLVFCAIDIMHRDRFIKFLSSNSQSLPSSETDEVFGCSTVQEGSLFGRCTCSVYRNRKIDRIHLFNVHSVHTYCPQPGRWLWVFQKSWSKLRATVSNRSSRSSIDNFLIAAMRFFLLVCVPSSSLSLDTSSIVAEASAVRALGLGRVFGVFCLPFPLRLGLSSQSQYRCPGCLHPKHFPAAINFLRSSSDILCIFAASNCMGK